MLDKAISLTARLFEGKFDKGGKPYILHCLTVMLNVEALGVEAQIAAVMHDVIEDTDETEESLVAHGFDPRTARRVAMLSHRADEDYMVYIKRVSIDHVTRAIKMADLEHNSDITRMKGLREKDFERLAKYHRAYAYLKEAEATDNDKS